MNRLPDPAIPIRNIIDLLLPFVYNLIKDRGIAMAEELITFKEAQEYLGISKAKMGRLAKEGSLPIYTDPLDKRKKLVPRAEVEKLKQPQAVKKETSAKIQWPEGKTFSSWDNPPPSEPEVAKQPPAEVKKPEAKPEAKKASLPLSIWDTPATPPEPKDEVNDG